MFGFFFKKNFCDIWDNLFHLLILNIIMVALILGSVALFAFSSKIPGSEGVQNLYGFAALFIDCMVLSVFIFAEGDNAAHIANFEGAKFSDYFKNIVPSIKDGVLFGLLIAFLITVAAVSIPYYFSIWVPSDGSKGSIVGLICMSFVFWFEVISLFSLQWFLAIRNLMHNNFRKCFKKSYIIFFDNVGFSILVGLVNLLNIVVTVFTLGMIPGIHGMTLTTTNALRLRLYKYDWYEVNPGMTPEQRKQVPWEDLIANDKNTLGPRKFKSFIFPWKE